MNHNHNKQGFSNMNKFNTRNNNNNTACKEFKSGSCRFGDRCRFSHDVATTAVAGEAPAASSSTSENSSNTVVVQEQPVKEGHNKNPYNYYNNNNKFNNNDNRYQKKQQQLHQISKPQVSPQEAVGNKQMFNNAKSFNKFFNNQQLQREQLVQLQQPNEQTQQEQELLQKQNEQGKQLEQQRQFAESKYNNNYHQRSGFDNTAKVARERSANKPFSRNNYTTSSGEVDKQTNAKDDDKKARQQKPKQHFHDNDNDTVRHHNHPQQADGSSGATPFTKYSKFAAMKKQQEEAAAAAAVAAAELAAKQLAESLKPPPSWIWSSAQVIGNYQHYGWTPLHEAAFYSNYAHLERLLKESGLDIHEKTTKEYSIEWGEYDPGDKTFDHYNCVLPVGATPLRVAQSTSRDLRGFSIAVTRYLYDTTDYRGARQQCIDLLMKYESKDGENSVVMCMNFKTIKTQAAYCDLSIVTERG